MQRQHIYRAWDIGHKKMYEPACVMFCPNEIREYRVFTASDGEFLGNDKHFDIMQYTGLKDKNGKEIYEGDIGTDINDDMYEVRFDDGAFVVIRDGNVIEPLSEVESYMEVIGNIYENPELISSNN